MKMLVKVSSNGQPSINLPTVLMGGDGSLSEIKADGHTRFLAFGLHEDGGFLFGVEGEAFDFDNLVRAIAVDQDTVEPIVQNLLVGDVFEYKFMHRSGNKTLLRLEVVE